MNTAVIIIIITIVVVFLIRVFGNALSSVKANLADISGGKLNKLNIYSNPAINALDMQLKSDRKYYSEKFTDFVNKVVADEAVRKIAYAYDASSGQDGWDTLIDTKNTDEEVAELVQNATAYAIAVTCTYYIKGTKVAKGIADTMTDKNKYPYKPTMSWSDYANYMATNQPYATAVARSLTTILGRQKSANVIAVMGYLIEQGKLE
ncbi:MAG: hypothetical protein WCP11_03410 [Candidatus Saccharibacteria bacterium]